MATVAVLGAAAIGAAIGAVVNAVAAPATNFVISLLEPEEDEFDRAAYTKAAQQLEKDRIEWDQKRTVKLDWLNSIKNEEYSSLDEFRRAEIALNEYEMAHKPVLSDYYNTNSKQLIMKQNGEIIFIGIGLVGGYFIISKIYRKLI